MLRKISAIVLVLAALAAAPSAFAQQPTPSDDEVNRIAKQLYCPVCENIPLDVCGTTACSQWRATIREKLAEGWSEQQIKDYFVSQYGERVLAEPSTRGINILVWIIPPVLLAAGAFVLWRFLRQAARRPPPAEAEAPTAPTDEYAARLEKELQARR